MPLQLDVFSEKLKQLNNDIKECKSKIDFIKNGESTDEETGGLIENIATSLKELVGMINDTPAAASDRKLVLSSGISEKDKGFGQESKQPFSLEQWLNFFIRSIHKLALLWKVSNLPKHNRRASTGVKKTSESESDDFQTEIDKFLTQSVPILKRGGPLHSMLSDQLNPNRQQNDQDGKDTITPYLDLVKKISTYQKP